MQAEHAGRSPFMAVLAIALVPVFFHLIVIKTSAIPLALQPNLGSLCKLGFVTVSALTHWGIYGSLLAAFALTLRPGHEPLITNMARRIHGEIDRELLSYTRCVTIAWVVFFTTQLSLSVGLFLFGPLIVWSFFVNILDIPLVAMMFAGEYAVRLRCLSHPPRHSLSTIFRMVADPMRQRSGPLSRP